ncbi:hypothetical protein Tco_0574035 [Tanacetum coccineum]
MLLLLVQGKLTNLNVEERLALGVSLRMFTKSIVLRRCVEDLQLGVKSYQKKLNLTRSDMYRSDLKRKSAYTTYSNPKGFIYQNKDKQHRLMHIDELHKFSDGTFKDVRSALNDILKNIRLIGSLEKIHWWETVRGRPLAAGKDHMNHHMISSSKQVELCGMGIGSQDTAVDGAWGSGQWCSLGERWGREAYACSYRCCMREQAPWWLQTQRKWLSSTLLASVIFPLSCFLKAPLEMSILPPNKIMDSSPPRAAFE